jgi:lipopolysaccharide transport system ATP-binding protein
MSQSDTAISVRNLSKAYTIAHQANGLRGRRPTFRDTVTNFLSDPFKRTPKETFWALKDVSFDVKKGDVVGIIGRNGAGKSTLLKILSRITKPTSGEIDVYGRIGSLLEVGTGFHPELTGRENIFLNGAILGMRREEIKRQFDAIVDFSEVEQFLDTPVKRYSSGMYVRLAFAVAAHLNPEILIVDEVLAVGDAEFQKKCLGKMGEAAKGGRTVLFVSHNMGAVVQLCKRALILESGALISDKTDVAAAIEEYLGSNDPGRRACWDAGDRRAPTNEFDARRFYVAASGTSGPADALLRDRTHDVVIEGHLNDSAADLCLGYALYAGDASLLYWSYQSDLATVHPLHLKPGPIVLRSTLPTHLLNHGEYRLELIGGRHGKRWFYEPGVSAPQIFVTVSGRLGSSPLWQCKRPGLLAPAFEWTLAGS